MDTEPVNAEVLITVKTYPTPSLRHMETVCVAGVRLDTPQPEWVRLYPIPFRVMGEEQQFKKYQRVTAPLIRRPTHDPRPESYSPVIEKMQLGSTIDSKNNWSKRRRLIDPLIGATSVCDLIAANRAVKMNEPAPSLGLIKPRDVHLSIKEGKPWRPKQLEKAKRAATPTLLDEDYIRTELEPMPYELRVKYKCESASCRGHNQAIIDWEVGSAAYNWRNRYPEAELPSRILGNWKSMLTDDKDTHFFVGNQHQHRHSFSVLGIWYPKLTS